MSSENGLVQLGEPDVRAKEIVAGPAGLGLSAAGTTQATATPIAGGVSTITTCAAGAGVQITTIGAFRKTLFNNTANPLLIYPPTGGTINALAQNAGYSLAAGKSAYLVSPDGINVVAMQG
jgi:uncharacterized protein (AIM24 family)